MTHSIPCDFFGVPSGNDVQDQKVSDAVRKVGLLLQRLVQRGLRLLCPAEVQLGHCLRDQTPHG